jgi:hypothetical protein
MARITSRLLRSSPVSTGPDAPSGRNQSRLGLRPDLSPIRPGRDGVPTYDEALAKFFVATFARTWNVAGGYCHVLANVATTVVSLVSIQRLPCWSQHRYNCGDE